MDVLRANTHRQLYGENVYNNNNKTFSLDQLHIISICLNWVINDLGLLDCIINCTPLAWL